MSLINRSTSFRCQCLPRPWSGILLCSFEKKKKKINNKNNWANKKRIHTQLHNLFQLAAFKDINKMIDGIVVGPFSRFAAQRIDSCSNRLAVLSNIHLSKLHLLNSSIQNKRTRLVETINNKNTHRAAAIIAHCWFVCFAYFPVKVLSKVTQLQSAPAISFVLAKRHHPPEILRVCLLGSKIFTILYMNKI